MKKRNKRKRKNKLGYFFFGALLLYLCIHFIPIIFSLSDNTSIAKYGNIKITENLDCYIIRNEKLIRSNTEGNIQYFVPEGKKVNKGYKVCEISRGNIDDATRKKLEIINQRIENLNIDKDNLFQNDIQKLNKEINGIIQDIKRNKEKGEFQKVYALEKELKNKLEKKNIITGDKSFAKKNLEVLKEEQKQLAQKINNAVMRITSPESGIISYHIDGYETIINPRNMATIQPKSLKKIDKRMTDLKTTKVINNQPLFKIIDNNLWYIITWIEPDWAEYYKLGKIATFKFPNGQIKGKICKTIKNKEEYMVIFQMDEYVKDFLSARKMNLDVTVLDYEGLKVYRDSVVTKDGQEGVYVLDINRYAKFKPIKIIGYDKQYAIIQNNIFYQKDGEDIKAISTVRLYDEVVRNAKKIKEGQKVY